MRITAIDFETANGNPASVCAVGISVMDEGVMDETYYSLIRPEENVSFFSRRNIAVHGIRPSDIKNAPSFAEVYDDIRPYLENAVVIAHNGRFDMNCLKAACLNTGRKIPQFMWFDTLELSRRVFRNLEHHRLNDVCDYLHVDLEHHNALSDADGCLMIVANVMNLTGIYEPEELCRACGVRMHEL